MNEYTNEQILEGLTIREIDNAFNVLKHINARSAYGHNPTFCQASSRLLRLLDRDNSLDYNTFNPDINTDEIIKSMIDYCKCQKEQLDSILKTQKNEDIVTK